MMTEQETNLVTLDSFPALTYRQKVLLLSELRSSEPDFGKCEEFLIKSLPDGVYNKVRELFYDGDYRAKTADHLAAKGIRCVTFFSEDYPEELKATPCPPLVLYCKGNLSLLKDRKFAIVGSRRSLPQILRQCEKISSEISGKFAVVTGMAEGADSAAIGGALKSGKVVSVLAHGFDYVYPAANLDLAREVEKRGLLVTEYPPDVAPKKFRFPVRNRIIAGLSEAVLVVSAGKKSGALITAEYAFDYNRTVFAFPYTIGVSSGEGCNSLLKKGGILAENILDIFSVFGLDCISRGQDALTEEERLLYELIRESGEAFVPALAEQMRKAPYQLIPLISSLEIKGLIVRLGGNRYAAL